MMSDAVAADLRVWAVPDCVKINPQTGQPYNHALKGKDYGKANPVFQDGRIRLYAARNETTAFQVVLQAREKAADRVDLRITDLAGSKGILPAAACVRLYREWFIQVQQPAEFSYGPGWYPEPLVPRDAPRYHLPMTVSPQRCEVVWVDLAVPADAAAGKYTAVLQVFSRDQVLAEIPLELQVWSFALPAEPSLVFDTPIYPGHVAHWVAPPGTDTRTVSKWPAAMKSLIRSMIELSHANRMNTYVYDCFPDTTGQGADIKLIWDAWDDLFGPYLDGSGFADGVPLSHFSLFVRARWPTPKDKIGTAEYEAAWISALKQIVQHFKEKGWTRTKLHLYVHEVDEVQLDKLDEIKYFSKLTRAAGVAYRQDIVHPREPRKYWEVVAPLCDVINVCARDVDPQIFTPEFIQKFEDVWIYQSHTPGAIGNFNIDAPAIDWRIWPWVAFRYGLTGCHDWACNYWTVSMWTDPLNWPRDPRARNGCGLHYWPGDFVGLDGRVIDAIRNKNIRRGQQDIEYLFLLKQVGKADLAEQLARRIVRHAGFEGLARGKKVGRFLAGDWQYDPQVFLETRLEIARFLAGGRQP